MLGAVPANLSRGGNAGLVSATLQDAAGNAAAANSVSVTALLTGPQGFSQSVSATSSNGAVSFDLSGIPLTNAGTYVLTISGASLTTVSRTLTVAQTTTTITWAPPASIAQGSPLTASQLNASASVAGTFTYMPAAGTILHAGTNTLSVTFTPADSNNYTTATASVQILVRAVSTTTLNASKTTELATMPLTFTVQVSSSQSGTPTGSVNFLDGTTLLGTVALGINGSASFTTTALPSGIHPITGIYSGDANYLTSTSSSASANITVGTINLDLGGDQNKKVVPGASVAYNFPLSPLVTPTFLYDVKLTATGLPPGATYTFSPASIPAGSGSVPVTLTVQTAKTTAALRKQSSTGSLALATLGCGFFLSLLLSRRRKAMPRLVVLLLCGMGSLATLTGLTGCVGGGFFGTTTTSGKYTINVTATSGSLVRTSTVQLTID